MKRVKETKQPSKPAEKIADDDYKPTPLETEAVAVHRAALAKRAPRLTITAKGDVAHIGVAHANQGYGMVALMHAMGTTDTDFYSGMLSQIVSATREKEASETGANFMLAVIKGIQPRDHIEAMLAAQMAAVHVASMTFARRLAHVENIPQQDSAERAFNKLTRTFAAQMEALKNYRSKGEQKMTVQHVHVADGGQAIVGNVNAPSEGGGAIKKSGEQPHALGHAPGATMPREIEAEREAMPSASGAGP